MSNADKVEPISQTQLEFLEESVSGWFAAMTDEIYDYYETERGLTYQTVARFRLGVVDTPPPGRDYLQDWLSIPYLGYDGAPWKVRFRRPPWSDSDAKYLDLPGWGPRMFNVRALHEAVVESDEIHVAEGECFRGDAEVLTPSGWVRLDKLEQGVPVAQYEMTGQLNFVKPLAYVKREFSGDLIERSNSQRYYSLTTPGHRVPAFGGRRDPFRFVTAEDGAPGGSRLHIPRAGVMDGPGIPLLDDEIRLLLAISADAAIDQRKRGDQYIRFGLTRQRKIERLRKLWANLGIEAHDKASPTRANLQSMCFTMPEHLVAFKLLPNEWLTLATAEQREMILKELRQWDGNGVPQRNQEEYSSKYRHNADWVQTLAHTAGRVSTVMPRSNRWGDWFKVSILHSKTSTDWQSIQEAEHIPHDGLVYCVQVPSSALLVRMNGSVSVSGNCDAMTLEQLGLHAVAIPGVKAWKSYHRRMLAGFSRVYVWADPDEAGQDLADTITNAMRQARQVRLTADVNDTYMQGGADALWDALN